MSTFDKRRTATRLHRLINPAMSRLPAQAALETIGRVTGNRHVTPIGGELAGQTYWFVSMDGRAADYVRNIEANNAVRLRLDGAWRSGRAYLEFDDDVAARNAQLPWLNRTVNRSLGSGMLSVRVELDP